MKKKSQKKSNSFPKLNTLHLSDNETLSMINRYKFDEKSSLKMQNDAQRSIDEQNILQEQKEYEEMNYYAIYRRMAKYSIIQILIILIKTILELKEQED